MATQSKRLKSAPAVETFETVNTVIGPAFTMPEPGAGVLAMSQEPRIDFQARQDSISATRRSLGAKLEPKVKRTSARPSPTRETVVKI